MNELILILFGLTIASALVITLISLVRSRRHSQQTGADNAERTPEQKARDRQSVIVWGSLAVALPLLLVLVYTVTR